MSNVARVAGQAANTLSKPLNVEEVFSTYLYEGGSNQTITNGIDLAGEGGMVWIKCRDSAINHNLYDTERGATNLLISNLTEAEQTVSTSLQSFNSDGFTLGTFGNVNGSFGGYASWTFRKAPKFFDVVTYTGNGVAGRQIAHNLGTTVGTIILKRTDASQNWVVFHRSLNYNSGNPYWLLLNLTNAESTSGGILSGWDDNSFTVTSSSFSNASGATYVAYLFAHNDGDGEFGPNGDQDIIKCGSFTANSGNEVEIDIGFEPQWILTKSTSSSGWFVFDAMRGMSHSNTSSIQANESNAEQNLTTGYVKPTATGWIDSWYGGTPEIIYIAIRRGPMAVPESATEVFAITTQSGSTAPAHDTGFVTDFSLRRENVLSSTSIMHAVDRLRGRYYLNTTGTNAEIGLSNNTWDFMDGWFGATSNDSNKYAWSWKRAPNYFDVVAYTGNGTAGRNISHNLGVVPEMMWVKRRNSATDWRVYHKDIGNTHNLQLNLTAAKEDDLYWNDTTPTDSVFTLNNFGDVNGPGYPYIAYLFASLDGVSKVGSVSHTIGSNTDVDCGFSAGARFVLYKITSGTGGWVLADTERGIVAGDDPYLLLNSTLAQISSTDDVADPYSSGFSIGPDLVTGDYIYYAIA